MTYFSRQQLKRRLQTDSPINGWLGLADLRGRLIVLGAVVLLYVFILESSLFSFFQSQHSWGVSASAGSPPLITRVEPNGPAWDSNIRPGDELILDEGRLAPLTDQALNALPKLRFRSQTSPGTIISLEEPRSGDPLRTLGPAAISLFFILAGGLVYVQSTTRPQARAFAATCLVAALALSAYPAGVLGQSWAIRLTFVCFVLIPAMFAYLFFVFPVDYTKRKLVRRYLLPFLTILPFVTLVLYAIALSGNWQIFSYAERASEVDMLLGIVIGLGSLLRGYFGDCSPRAKQQLQIAVSGTLLGVIPFITFSVLPVAISPLTGTTYQNIPASPSVTVLATVLIPISFGYAILKHQLIKSDVVIRRSVIYLAVTLSTVVCYLLIVSAFTQVFETVTGGQSVITLVVAACVVALIAEPIRSMTQSWVERVFFSDITTYHQILDTSGTSLNTLLSPDEIFSAIASTISTAFSVKHIAIFAIDREKQLYRLRWDQGGARVNDLALGRDHPLVRLVKPHGQPVILKVEHLGLLTPPVAGGAGHQGGSSPAVPPTRLPNVLVPLKTGGEVVAILALGPRADEDPYSGADLEFLGSAAARYSVALDNALLHETVRNQANTDALTGLFNHRYLHQRLNQEIAIAQEKKRPLGVLMMDVDSFKFFNDTYGHPVGDRVLGEISHMLQDVCAESGIVGRYGGDEFVVILPGHDRAAAEQVADRISAATASLVFHVGIPTLGNGAPVRETLSLSLTIGVAAMPEHGETSAQLISAADVAMYGQKRGPSETAKTLPDLVELPPGPLRLLMAAVEQKDGYVAVHSERAAHWAVRLAAALGLSEHEQRIIRLAGLLHDVGKLGISEKILNKAGKLTPLERRVMEGHVDLSVRLVTDAPDQTRIIEAIRHHHERWDGLGYPRGIAGEAIPFLGRILAVADVYSALTTDRPYRHRMTSEGAVEWISSQAGTQFDPQVAEALRAVLHAGESFQLPTSELSSVAASVGRRPARMID